MKQNELIAKKMSECIPHIVVIESQTDVVEDDAIGLWRFEEGLGFKHEALTIIDSCVDGILDFNYHQKGPLFNYLDEQFVRNNLIEIATVIKTNPDSNKYNLFANSIGDFLNNVKIIDFFSYLKIANLKISKIYDFDSFKLYPNTEKYRFELFLGTTEKQKHELEDAFNEKSDVYQTIMELRFFTMDARQARKKTLHSVNDYLNVFRVLGAQDIFYEGDFNRKYNDIFILNRETLELGRFGQFGRPQESGRIFDLFKFEQKYPHIIKKIQILFNNNANELEKKMLNSLLWWGDSISEPNLSHKLLKMIISIESLLLNSEDRGTKLICLKIEAVFLLANNYKKRCWISDTLKEAYTVRNKIVHSGEKQIIPNRLVRDLSSITVELNMLLLTSDKFKVFDDIKREVNDKKFQKT